MSSVPPAQAASMSTRPRAPYASRICRRVSRSHNRPRNRSTRTRRALKLLRARLFDMERERTEKARAAERKGLIGSGDRSERIRTYNYPQGRVTDHRINLTLYKLDKIIAGDDLGEIIDALITEDQATR